VKYGRLTLVIAGLICLVFLVHSQDDPAISEMENAMDMPVASVQNLTSSWHLELTSGMNINLILSQSGSIVSGRRQCDIGQCLSKGDGKRYLFRKRSQD